MSRSGKAPLSPVTALRNLLSEGVAGSQEELRQRLEDEMGVEVTQSTVSRCLKKLAAIKTVNAEGDTVYQLRDAVAPPAVESSLSDLVLDVASNDTLIVIRTSPGSASLIARHLDHRKPEGILGTIAGDDTIFVAPASARATRKTVEEIKALFQR